NDRIVYSSSTSGTGTITGRVGGWRCLAHRHTERLVCRNERGRRLCTNVQGATADRQGGNSTSTGFDLAADEQGRTTSSTHPTLRAKDADGTGCCRQLTNCLTGG